MADRKKVMWLIKGLGAGGAEKLLSTAVPYLDRDAFQYEVAYLLPGKNDLVPEFQQAGIPVFCLGASRAYDLGVGVRLVRLLKERKVDLLHIHLPYTAVLGRLSAQAAGVRAIVYTEHNLQEMYNPITRFFNRLTYPLDAATIAVSAEVQRSCLRRQGPRPKRMQVIPGGVDVQAIDCNIRDSDNDAVKASLGIPKENLVVGNVAHIRPEKGHTYLVEAAAQVLGEYPKTTFVIVGREKAEGTVQALKARVAELGIQDQMVFAGFRQDAIRCINTFDIFVLSSLYEGLPIALLEAMALGVPPVATAVGGIPEVIDEGTDGFLVSPRDPSALAEGIGRLLADPELRRTFSDRAAKKVRERFSIQKMVAAVENVYRVTLNSKGQYKNVSLVRY